MSSTQVKPTPEHKLDRLSQDIYVYNPQSDANMAPRTNSVDPHLIIIFGWMEGKIWSLKKYTGMYHKMYPCATQLLLLSRSSSSWSSDRTNAKLLEPAVTFLKAGAFLSGSPAPNILIHVLSNGGGFQLLRLSDLLSKSNTTGYTQADTVATVGVSRPGTAVILDSVPGDAGLGPALEAHTAGLRPFIVKLLAMVPLSLLYYAVMSARWLMGQPNLFTALRDGLKESRLFPGMDKSTPRLFVYSREDRIVQVEAVERHIEELKREGFNVSVEQFSGSQHVAHSKEDPGRYWKAVDKTWKQAGEQCN